MKKKATIAVVALALVLCFAIGGTLAWLIAKTGPVVNTFTYGDINIDLSESEGLDLKMIPGNDIKKDPKVTVEAGSEACWLFVKVVESDNFDDFMEYSIATGWTALDGDAGVYYREVDADIAETGTSYQVLAGNDGYSDGYVTVQDTVTKEMLNALTEELKPTLTFTAYAVQKDGFDSAVSAWTEINK